jgi:hypothetical protein
MRRVTIAQVHMPPIAFSAYHIHIGTSLVIVCVMSTGMERTVLSLRAPAIQLAEHVMVQLPVTVITASTTQYGTPQWCAHVRHTGAARIARPSLETATRSVIKTADVADIARKTVSCATSMPLVTTMVNANATRTGAGLIVASSQGSVTISAITAMAQRTVTASDVSRTRAGMRKAHVDVSQTGTATTAQST